jgi:hypothetical protein
MSCDCTVPGAGIKGTRTGIPNYDTGLTAGGVSLLSVGVTEHDLHCGSRFDSVSQLTCVIAAKYSKMS